MANMHSHDGLSSHSHDTAGFNAAEHGHSHEILDGPGSYMGREMPLIEGRDWTDRAFTVGIGGYAPNNPSATREQVVGVGYLFAQIQLGLGTSIELRLWEEC